MKRCAPFLLLIALSGSLPAIAAGPASAPPATQTTQPHYLPQPAEVAPEHECKTKLIRAATPTADFIDNRDGTVTHKKTGLVWMRCSLGQQWKDGACTGKALQYKWKKALQAAPNFNAAAGYAGHKDWRLPNIKELDSIVETQCMNPAINSEVFPATPSFRFWSSTLSTSHEFGYAWYIRFDEGYVDDGRTWEMLYGDDNPDEANGLFSYHMRLVRGGQPADSFDAGPPKQARGKKK